MIAPILELESVVQIADKTRLDASKSFISKDETAVTNVEIEPEAGAGFITVFAADQKNWYLDWMYSGASRTVVVSCKITNAGGDQTLTKSISILTAADDKLFSADSDLTGLESDILKYVRKGRSSFLDVHRMAQKKIIEWMDEAGLRNDDGTKVTKAELLDLTEVQPWSRDLTLSLIFMGISNQVDDVFMKKSIHYTSQAKDRSDRAVLAWDSDKSGAVDLTAESVGIQSVVMER